MTSQKSSSRPSAQLLRRTLSPRHIHFIALGSAIGTGLFYGSAKAIQAAGPSILLVYLLCGAVVYFMLRALGEMAVHLPISGSFAEYCRRYLGSWAGYITGWMYAFEMVIVCIADLTAIGFYMKFWYPESSQWIWVLATLLIVGGANLTSARWFGELETGLTILKVSAVVLMIVGGGVLITLNLSNPSSNVGFDNMVNDGGFFPNGISGMFAALILAMFAFGGTEIIGVTAGEAQDPAKTIPKAVNTVPFRILLFYVLTIFVIITLQPWRTIDGSQSPFVSIFSELGISWAATALNVVVISAAVSAINSDLYGAGRIIFGMASRGLAPRAGHKLSGHGIPVRIIGTLILVLLSGVVLNYLLPERVFEIVAALATFATVFVWLMILLAHLAMRRRMTSAEVKTLQFPVPFWPYGQWFAIAMIAVTIIVMAYSPDYRLALAVGVTFTVLMTAVYYTFIRDGLTEDPAEEAHQQPAI